MLRDGISENLINFVLQGLDSIEQMMVLLLLYEHPERVWSTAEITMELRSTGNSIEKRLKYLYARNILVAVPELNGKHKFSPASEDIGNTVCELAKFYQSHPYRVIDLIYSGPTYAVRSFSEAFRLRKD